MNNQTSILTDTDLDAVTGGAVNAFMQGMAAGAAGGGKQRPPNFGVAPTGGGTSVPCNSNHNGVVYPPL